jgi:hypothetical protein
MELIMGGLSNLFGVKSTAVESRDGLGIEDYRKKN